MWIVICVRSQSEETVHSKTFWKTHVEGISVERVRCLKTIYTTTRTADEVRDLITTEGKEVWEVALSTNSGQNALSCAVSGMFGRTSLAARAVEARYGAVSRVVWTISAIWTISKIMKVLLWALQSKACHSRTLPAG